MCGRFAFFSPREAVTELFGVDAPLGFEPRYNITPSQHVVAIRADDSGNPALAMLRWGLIPSWAKENRSAPNQCARGNCPRETVIQGCFQAEALRDSRRRVLRMAKDQ